MSPDELYRNTHESSHAYCWFHVVGEHEECATGGYYASVQIHTYTYACHCQFAYASLEECAGEVVGSQVVCLLEEAVGLVGVAKVGGRAYHVGHLLGKDTKTCSGCCSCSDVALLCKYAPVHLRRIP